MSVPELALLHLLGSYASDILNKRYDNERIIINANLKRFIDLPMLKYESADALKRMLDVTNGCIAALKLYHFNAPE